MAQQIPSAGRPEKALVFCAWTGEDVDPKVDGERHDFQIQSW